MADLTKGSYTYTQLANKYGNFCAPAKKIKIGGKDVLSSLHLAVADINISLSMDSASIVSFQIAGAYDEKTHSFLSSVKDKFELGTVVEVEIGYLSNTTAVFKGFVASRGVNFSTASTLSITLADARKLMMTGTKNRYYEVDYYSEAVTMVMKDYSKLCSLKADATKEKLTEPILQEGNDYNFIMHKLIQGAKLDREFFILGDMAYFREPTEKTDVITTVSFGRELLSFSQQETYGGVKFKVAGFDPVKGELIKGDAEVSSPDGQKKATSKIPEYHIASQTADTAEKAKKMAKAMAKRKKKEGKNGSAEVVGLPELVPGRYIKIEGMDSMVNGTYYIASVTHSIGSGGFQTSLELEGGSG